MQKNEGTEIPGTDARRQLKKDAEKQPTTDPKLADPEKTPGSGMVPDGNEDAPSG
jgi:hypothetical protein